MLIERIIGVLKLDVNTFEEIEHDQNATGQAAIVVAFVAVISAIGNAILGAVTDGSILGGAISAIITTFLGWFIWSAITYFVGTTLFDGEADLGEMLRVIGFAYAPQVLAIIPCIGTIIGAIWGLAAGFVAVRQGLDIDNGKAALTIGIGFIGYLVIVFAVGAVFGIGAAVAGGIAG